MNEQAIEGVAAADRARTELYDTLTQLRGRLDYAQRIDDSVSRAKHRVAEEKRDNPLLFAAGVLGTAAVVGVATWAIANKIIRAFQ